MISTEPGVVLAALTLLLLKKVLNIVTIAINDTSVFFKYLFI